MSNKKQSSIDWLVEQIGKYNEEMVFIYQNEIEQAKAMRKEELEFAFKGGMSLVEGRLYKPVDLFEEFYNKKLNNDGDSNN